MLSTTLRPTARRPERNAKTRRDTLMRWGVAFVRLLPWVLLAYVWLLAGAPAVVVAGHRLVDAPADVQIIVVAVLGAMVITVLCVRSVVRANSALRAVPAARTAALRGTIALAANPESDDPRAAALLAKYPDPRFVTWVLSRVCAMTSPAEALEYADTVHAPWLEFVNLQRDVHASARHEAAHAVVGHSLGCTVTRATIAPSGARFGFVEYTLPVPRVAPGDEAWIAMVSGLAGRAADHGAGIHDGGSRSDVRDALDCAAVIVSSGHRPDGYEGPLTSDGLIAAATKRAAAILEAHQALFDELTARLVETTTLTGAALFAVLAGPPGREGAS